MYNCVNRMNHFYFLYYYYYYYYHYHTPLLNLVLDLAKAYRTL